MRDYGIPWFMYDMDNHQLITSKTIPSDIRDTKQIILTEQPVPGLNYMPVVPGGGGNRKISFTLPLLYRNPLNGNIGLVKQFDMLRNQSAGFFGSIFGKSLVRMSKVLYYWGTGSLPLVWWVSRADATHKQGWVTAAGFPMYSEIEIELVLDETHPLYKAEEVYRNIEAYMGTVGQAYELGRNAISNANKGVGTSPYGSINLRR